MGNIWEFLYQTLNVSLVAALLLLVKWLLHDKLPPRWQYGVWVILALRVLLPADTSRGLVPSLALWLETAKSAAEMHLASAYSGAFEVIGLESAFPWIDAAPVSVTDWLFVLYAAGVLATVLRYAAQYLRLRRLLRRGEPVCAATEAVIAAVAEEHGLRKCRAVAVPGLKSAFVCGVFRPVLAVPEGETPDRKILLHELLHLKYFDALQNALWSLMRALHWCNPFMQYVFDRIGNDMESLCDQRVLERLRGEERREYGGILLGMASESYARVPGTSSISNGAANIARRIEAIVRFKLYPRGMALVGVCSVIVLGVALLTGAQAGYRETGSVMQALAMSRLERCTTLAGALDVYAHGLSDGNAMYLASASPMSRQEEYYELMTGGGEVAADIRALLADVRRTYEPRVYNLRPDGEGGYLATLELSGEWVHETTANIYTRHVLIPVAISYDNGWVVDRHGELTVTDKADIFHEDTFREYARFGSAECAGGRIEAGILTEYTYSPDSDGRPDPDAEFSDYWCNIDVRFYRDNWTWDGELAETVSLQYRMLEEYDENLGADFFEDIQPGGFIISSDGSGGTGAEIENNEAGYIQSFGGSGGTMDVSMQPDWEGVAACVFVNSKAVGNAVLKLEAVR